MGFTADIQHHWAISLYGAAYAAALLSYYRMLGAFRSYHLALLGGLAVVCLLPIWGGAEDKVSPVMVPMGLVTIAVGLFDHRDLLKSMRRARSAGIDEGINWCPLITT